MRLGVLVWAILAFVSVADAASPPPLLYQGRLTGSAGAATGNFDFVFTVYDTSGEPIGTALASDIKNNVAVSNGLFHCELNFSQGVFDGSPRWLSISVRTNGSVLPHVLLSPRQIIGSTPYAVRSAVADTVPGASLTDLNASAISSGTVADTRLSENVARRDAENSFNAKITVNGQVVSSSGGFKFPDGTVQTTAAAPPKILASVNVNYSLDDRTNNWTQISNLADDVAFVNLPLGFTFNGFGTTTTNVSLSSNGVLFFGNNTNVNWANSSLPSNMSIDPMLFFFWDDLLDSGPNDFAEYITIGSAGGRVFNLYFRNRLRTACNDGSGITALISIHEGSNLVKVSYSGMTTCSVSRGSGATIGIQTAGGANATAFMVGYNSPVLDDNSPNQTISFQPGN